MKNLIVKNNKIIFFYLLSDTFAIGIGMGVPIFAIFLGFPFGWFFTNNLLKKTAEKTNMFYKQLLKISLITSLYTFLLMIIVWWKAGTIIFSSVEEIKNFGHPFILYDPKLSLIGWVILMVVISPFLQLLTTVFASFVRLCRKD